MRPVTDLTGIKFGKYTVLKWSHKNKWDNHFWKCICDCGKKRIVHSGSLTRMDRPSRSCGCIATENARISNTGRMKLGLEPTVHPEMKDIYWAAGIYEGG